MIEDRFAFHLRHLAEEKFWDLNRPRDFEIYHRLITLENFSISACRPNFNFQKWKILPIFMIWSTNLRVFRMICTINCVSCLKSSFRSLIQICSAIIFLFIYCNFSILVCISMAIYFVKFGLGGISGNSPLSVKF